MADKLKVWNDGHEHMWTYFGGMASCVHCAATVSPGGKVSRPSLRSRQHRQMAQRAAKSGARDRG